MCVVHILLYNYSRELGLAGGGLAGLELASIYSCSMQPAVFCIFMGAWPPRFDLPSRLAIMRPQISICQGETPFLLQPSLSSSLPSSLDYRREPILPAIWANVSKSLICSFFRKKNERFAQKTDERIPNPVFNPLYKIQWRITLFIGMTVYRNL